MIREWTRTDTVGFLRVPTADDDKYSRGVVALRTGSAAYPGAAVLGVEAAWRSGAGYVRYLGDAPDAVLARRPETVVGSDLGRTRVDAWVVGSGVDAAHRSEHEQTVLRRILAGEAPVVVDAGALDLAQGSTAPVILTPHGAELDRLRVQLDLTAPTEKKYPQRDHAQQIADTAETAAFLDVVVLSKGAHTVIASPGDPVIVVSNGPPWLATAGTGDVLAGIVGALLAANPDQPRGDTAAAAVWLHGAAARRASGARHGAIGHPIVAMDVAEALPATIAELIA